MMHSEIEDENPENDDAVEDLCLAGTKATTIMNEDIDCGSKVAIKNEEDVRSEIIEQFSQSEEAKGDSTSTAENCDKTDENVKEALNTKEDFEDLLLIAEEEEDKEAPTSTAVINSTNKPKSVAAAIGSSIGGSLAAFSRYNIPHRHSTEEDNDQTTTLRLPVTSSPAGALFSRFRGAGRAAPTTSHTATATTTATATPPPVVPSFVFTEKEADAPHKKQSHWDGWSQQNKYFGLEVQHPFSTLMLEKKKTVDIRRYELPKQLWNKPLLLLETPSSSSSVSKIPNVVCSEAEITEKYNIQPRGWFTVRECIKYTSLTEFTQDEVRHCVGPDSEYGWLKGYTKELYGWVIDSVTTTTPSSIHYMIRRMRSLYELGGIVHVDFNLRDKEDPKSHDLPPATVEEESSSFSSNNAESLKKEETEVIAAATTLKSVSLISEANDMQSTIVEDNSTANTPSATDPHNEISSIVECADNTFNADPELPSFENKDSISQTPSLPDNSTITPTTAASLNDLQKANAKIAALMQTNSLLSSKHQELQAQMNSQANVLEELQLSLQKQLEQCGELSHEKKNLLSSVEKERIEKEASLQKNAMLEEERQTLLSDKLRMSNEIQKLKEKVMELETRESTAIARLNESKKQEAIKSREVVVLQSELASIKPQLAEFSLEKEAIEKERAKYTDRASKVEEELKKELELNEERKKKMKEYVTTKAEELRNTKDTNAALRRELEEMRSQYKLNRDQLQDAISSLEMKDADLRILKSELERVKADSEVLHRMGNSLESELSRSAKEVSEHKHKRLEAKQELMTMLRKLETEQKSCKELKEKIKFTFTPKAISQQKLLNESVESLESALLRLSRRLGKPLPQRTITSTDSAGESGDQDEGRPMLNGSKGRSASKSAPTSGKLSEWDSSRLVQILEDETQHVSQSIMTLTSSVDRIYMLLEDPTGDRTCVSSFADILSGRHQHTASVNDQHPIEPARGVTNNRWARSFR